MKFTKTSTCLYALFSIFIAAYFILGIPHFLWGALILLTSGIIISIGCRWKNYISSAAFNEVFKQTCGSLSESSTPFYKIKNQIGRLFNKVIHLKGLSSCWLIMKDEDGVYRYKVLRGENRERTSFRNPFEYFGSDKISDSDPLIIPSDSSNSFLVRHISLVFPLCEGEVINGFVGFSGARKKILKEYSTKNFKALTSLIKWMYKNAFKIRQLELQSKKTSTAAESAGEELSYTNRRLINRVKELKSLYNLSVAVYDSSSPQEAANTVFREISSVMGVKEGVYFELYGDRLRAKAFSRDSLSKHLGELELPSDFVPDNRVVEITKLSSPGSEKIFSAFKTPSLVAVPAKVADTLKGLFLLKAEEGMDYSVRDFELLEMYSSRLAEFIERDENLKNAINNSRRLESLNKIKDNFIALMSHELKTPLTSIKGFIDLLLAGDTGQLNEQQEDFILTIKKSVEDLEKTINSIIETGNITRGKTKIKKQPEDFIRIARGCFKDYKERFEDKKLNYKITVDNSIPKINLDEEKIQKAIESLLDNAVKFTSEGGDITVAVEKKGDFAQFSVADSGIGISKNLKKRIFEKFFQHQNPKTRNIGGLGLGLTFARSVIVSHGGQIHIDSSEAGGTEVSFILPLK